MHRRWPAPRTRSGSLASGSDVSPPGFEGRHEGTKVQGRRGGILLHRVRKRTKWTKWTREGGKQEPQTGVAVRPPLRDRWGRDGRRVLATGTRGWTTFAAFVSLTRKRPDFIREEPADPLPSCRRSWWLWRCP